MNDSLSNFVKGNISESNKSEEIIISTQTLISDAIADDTKLNEIESESKPEVVILIGFPGYGKTSFVSTIYQLLLQNGVIGDYEFYDSDTFIGFERRVFARRLSNYNNESQTKRTLRGESYILTLHFKHPKYGHKVLVFSDRSGEDYEEYANRKNTSASDKLMRYADKLLFFINCEELINHAFLHLKDKYGLLLNNLKSSGVFSANTAVNLLYNKSDLITENNQDKFTRNQETLRGIFSTALGEESFSEHLIVSNDINNVKTIENLILEILGNSSERKISKENSLKLDWVKNIINNK